MTVVEFLGTQSPLLPITVLVHSDCLQGLRICPDVLEFRSMRLNHTADECDQEAAREALVASIRQFRPGFDFKEYLKSMSGKPPEDPEPAEADLPDLETALPGMTRKGNP